MKNSSVFKLYKPIPDEVNTLSAKELEALTPEEIKTYNLARQVRQAGAEGLFAKDEEGNDWYQWLKTLSSETLKVAYRDSDKVIMQHSFDATAIFPVEQRVAEVSIKNVPAEFIESGFNLLGQSIYSNGKIKSIPIDYVVIAEQQKNEFMQTANNRIAPLQDAIDLGISNPEETNLLMSWKKYRVLVSRIDTSQAPDIDWPEQPQ